MVPAVVKSFLKKSLRAPRPNLTTFYGRAEFHDIIRYDDQFLGAYCVWLLGVIALNWETPLWNAPLALGLWLVFLFFNLTMSQISIRSRRFEWVELTRSIVTLILLALIFFQTGGSQGNFWYGYGIMILGLSTVFLGLRISHPLPLIPFAISYLFLYLWDTPKITKQALGQALGHFGFFILISGFTVKTLQALRDRSQHLREEQERFQQLANNIQEVFWIASLDRRKFFYVSPAYEKIWERSLTHLYQDPQEWTTAINPDDQQRTLEAYSGGPEGGFTVEYRIFRADGSMSWIWERGFPVKNSEGKIIRVAGIAQDITEEKKAATTLDEQRALLAQSAKMSSLGEMAAGIAHEINNPLAIILGKAHQLLVLSKRNEAAHAVIQDAMEKIIATSMRISKIIKGLHSFAKETGDEKFQAIPLEGIISDTLGFCEARFKQHGIDLRISPFPKNLELECRPVQISQVLLNLLSNAFDAVEKLPERWVQVSVVEQKSRVEISVTDSGKGIPKEAEWRIMEPFFTTKEKGVGLGLSISKGLVEAHHGNLGLDMSSTYTRFIISLPKTQPVPDVRVRVSV